MKPRNPIARLRGKQGPGQPTAVSVPTPIRPRKGKGSFHRPDKHVENPPTDLPLPEEFIDRQDEDQGRPG